MVHRRTFVKAGLGALAAHITPRARGQNDENTQVQATVSLSSALPGEDISAYLRRTKGSFDASRYKQILGAANPFKEGDQIVGVAASDENSRATARALLAATPLSQIDAHPPLEDELFRLLQKTIDRSAAAKTANLTLGELKRLLLFESEAAIRAIMPGLSSDVIGCVVK